MTSARTLTRCRRTIAVAAVALLSLVVTGPAHAAIAGGNPGTSTTVPDIRGATILDGADVQVCFDKPLSPSSAAFTPPYDYMWLVGYNASSNYLQPAGATLDAKNTDCVDLAFGTRSGSLDLGQFTAAVATYGAVETAGNGGQVNWADSTALLGSTTHNGTSGLSSAPDLTGPAAIPYSSSSPNDIAYVFDQTVDPTTVTPSDFWYENASGRFCFADGVGGVQGTVVTVHFATRVDSTCADTAGAGNAPSVTDARRAGVLAGAVADVSNSHVYNAGQGTNMPGVANGGTTSLAALVSATLGPQSGQVTYTFDHPLDASHDDARGFFVTLANGDVWRAASATAGTSAGTVVVTFSNLQYFDEYAVQAGVDNNAVEASNGTTGTNGTATYTNVPGAVPIGGNAGAFARGFTTGPDMYAASFDTARDLAVADFDQRVAGTEWTSAASGRYKIQLLDAAGNLLGPPATVTVPALPNPGPVAITMGVDPAIMAEHPAQIALDPYYYFEPYDTTYPGCAFYTALENAASSDACSVPQIVSATSAAERLRAIRSPRRSRPRRRAAGRHRRRMVRALTG